MSAFIRVISLGRAGYDDTTNIITKQLRSISSHPTLRQLLLRPTVGAIRQHRQTKFITTLTGMDPQRSPSILPALKEIRFITVYGSYIPTQHFVKLRRLHVDMENIHTPTHFEWPCLSGLHLKGVNMDIECLERFLKNHKHIEQLHLAFVCTLRPLRPSSDELQQCLKTLLNSRLDTEVTGSIMRQAEKNASGHERSLLRELHAQLEKFTDEKTATEMRQMVVTIFEKMLEVEFANDIAVIGEMRIPPENPSLELSCSIEYFWEDELAIKGITLPGVSETGVWTNDEIGRGLGFSTVNTRKSVQLRGMLA